MSTSRCCSRVAYYEQVIDDKSLTEAVRDAIDRHTEERRKDEQFKERLRQRYETERRLYERLAR